MCKTTIEAGERHLRCSVSSCNSGRMKLLFCSERCWKAHIPTARHRKASYVVIAPAAEESAEGQSKSA
jgi:hypothetical protein